ncbi:hypothetical protein [Pseudomonas coronafaciens]|uniref:hypothetical protein n=2 Tax=Pseudomonas TaxID=286 RepID=UPI001F2915B4|nr:hypothetical protein [Pseudomonas coronafaciens]
MLALTGIFEIGKAHLAHGRLGSGGQAYFITFGDLFGDSLAPTWWSKADINKQWGKPVVTASGESRLERLDMKFAAEHAKKATKATTSPSILEMSEDETGAPYLLLEQTLLQRVYIAEQLGAIPPLDEKWLARVIPPSLRQLSQIQKSTGLH